MEEKSAAEIMKDLRKVRIPALFDDEDRPYSHKLISIYSAITEITLPGDYAEFGVFKGRCAHFISGFLRSKRKLHLFDSFEGLPEAWVDRWKEGAFRLEQSQIPQFSSPDVVIYKGWFKDTVPGFASTLKQPLSFIHMDADLYSSTVDVLFNLNHLVAPNTIILFDEYVMKGTDDEHRALVDWAKKFNRKYEYLWRTSRVQVCIRVTE